VKIIYFNKREIKKRVRGVILSQKLTLNHPSLVDEGEKTRILMTDDKRERGREREKNPSLKLKLLSSLIL